ncbi:MAG: substrate-binding domain-containing protein [Xanthomonadales bacterium]|nr:substrate-binding domain-containing protein [Xanthomonadales bacterium]
MRLTALLLLASLLVRPAMADEILRLHGSNTVGEALAPALVQAWLKAEGFEDIRRVDTAFEELEWTAQRRGSRRVVQIHAHGSSTGFADLASGSADVGMSSRPVKASDRNLHARMGDLDRPGQEFVLALDGIAIIVNPRNPFDELGKDRVRDLFSGRIRDWSQIRGSFGGAVKLHARDDRSGTYDSFKTLVLGDARLSSAAKRYESTEELAAAVAADPMAIGFVGLSGLRGVRALAISDGGGALLPKPEEVAVEDYPLSRRLFLYVPKDAPALARRFAEFATSPAAQPIVQKIGFVDQAIRAYAVPVREDAPDSYRTWVTGAERLSLNFRFGEGARMLDSKTMMDLDRLAAFLKQPGQRERTLILLGFSDAVETLPAMALFMSTDRADYIASLLLERGVAPRRVRGLGSVAPVASNDDAVGRQRNRRVEVWLAEPGASAGVASGGNASRDGQARSAR